MKVEIEDIEEFNKPAYLIAGDSIRCTYKGRQLSMLNVQEDVTFTHAIMFRLDGVLNHLIGNSDTIDWLRQ